MDIKNLNGVNGSVGETQKNGGAERAGGYEIFQDFGFAHREVSEITSLGGVSLESVKAILIYDPSLTEPPKIEKFVDYVPGVIYRMMVVTNNGDTVKTFDFSRCHETHPRVYCYGFNDSDIIGENSRVVYELFFESRELFITRKIYN